MAAQKDTPTSGQSALTPKQLAAQARLAVVLLDFSAAGAVGAVAQLAARPQQPEEGGARVVVLAVVVAAAAAAVVARVELEVSVGPVK